MGLELAKRSRIMDLGSFSICVVIETIVTAEIIKIRTVNTETLRTPSFKLGSSNRNF